MKVLIIYGPTATGKTALALQLARKFHGELISADSRQVYKGLDIGTGKVSFESKIEKYQGYWVVDGVKIHGFDLVELGKQFTVADFLKFANDTMIRIIRTKRLPIVVGGTGFYIKSVLEGLDTQGIPSNPALRKKLEKLNREELYQYLQKINPSKAKSLNVSDRLNPRRLIRAIEIAVAKTSTSEESEPFRVNLQGEPTSEVKEALVIGLTAPNSYLYKKADESFMDRLNHGMIDEVKTLLSNNVSPRWLDNLGLEYRWLTKFVLGQISKEEALKRCKGELHSFIRRQKTWFKQYKFIKIYDISTINWPAKLEKDVKLWYNSHSLQAFA